mmetsp:Transcript_31944/g.69757  ORF Transcript_31944/g.69757 Transcript_31944/m.69757 type:complete len:240 (-) Transcript_31944:6-725(-)
MRFAVRPLLPVDWQHRRGEESRVLCDLSDAGDGSHDRRAARGRLPPLPYRGAREGVDARAARGGVVCDPRRVRAAVRVHAHLLPAGAGVRQPHHQRDDQPAPVPVPSQRRRQLPQPVRQGVLAQHGGVLPRSGDEGRQPHRGPPPAEGGLEGGVAALDAPRARLGHGARPHARRARARPRVRAAHRAVRAPLRRPQPWRAQPRGQVLQPQPRQRLPREGARHRGGVWLYRRAVAAGGPG